MKIRRIKIFEKRTSQNNDFVALVNTQSKNDRNQSIASAVKAVDAALFGRSNYGTVAIHQNIQEQVKKQQRKRQLLSLVKKLKGIKLKKETIHHSNHIRTPVEEDSLIIVDLKEKAIQFDLMN